MYREYVMVRIFFCSLCLVLTSAAVIAGPAHVETVTIRAEANGTYRFIVTVRHADEGWDHYADRWEILSPGGALLATRTLYHPHVEEQPFTRDLAGVSIPEDIHTVVVRAHDSVHGFSGMSQTVSLPGR
jgi:hypothetical protein